MPEISVRSFLQMRSEAPCRGIRHLAPELKTISVRSLINMERVIIHLSDLHIGMNNDPPSDTCTPESQANATFETMALRYYDQNPKPIVVITGDVECVGCSSAVKEALGRGLHCPNGAGNHDFSDEINTDDMSFLETIPILGDVWLKPECAGIATSRGYSPQHVSGVTYADKAVSNVAGLGLNSHNYYGTERWKCKGAAFDLTFALADSIDPDTVPPDAVHWAGTDLANSDVNPDAEGITIGETEDAEVPANFFLLNKFLRLAHGYFNANTYSDLLLTIDSANASGARVILCMHNWIDYWIPNVLQSEESAAIAILNCITPDTTPAKISLSADWNRTRLSNPNFRVSGSGCLWNEYSLGKGMLLSDPNPPPFADGEPVTRSQVFDVVSSCHLLLVGHRHLHFPIQDLRKQLEDNRSSWKSWLAEANLVRNSHSTGDIADLVRKNFNEINGLIEPVLANIDDPPVTGNLREVAVDVALKTDLNIDIDARFNALGPMLAYYHEAGSPVPDANPGSDWAAPRNWLGAQSNGIKYRSWAELRINLHTGAITWQQLDNA